MTFLFELMEQIDIKIIHKMDDFFACKIILRLQQYYDAHFTEAIYYVKNQMFYFNFVEDNSVIVRVFPLEDYYKLDLDNKMKTYKFGILYINEENNFQMQDIDA